MPRLRITTANPHGLALPFTEAYTAAAPGFPGPNQANGSKLMNWATRYRPSLTRPFACLLSCTAIASATACRQQEATTCPREALTPDMELAISCSRQTYDATTAQIKVRQKRANGSTQHTGRSRDFSSLSSETKKVAHDNSREMNLRNTGHSLSKSNTV